MADISKKNRPISETKRRRVSILTLCLCFVGRGFHRKYCRIHHAIASTIFGSHLGNMAAMSKVIRQSQKVRGVEPSISTLCLGFVGLILTEKVVRLMCQYQVSTILTFMAAIL